MRLLVVGGSGYLGTRIVRQALKSGHAVTAISRRGGPPQSTVTPAEELAGAEWISGDVTDSAAVASAVAGKDAVITTLGVFGSNAYMRAINGDTNIAIARAAKDAGASRFVHVSAADFGLIENLIPGYFGGKRAADAEISRLFGDHGAILRPGMIHGTRQAGSIRLPLWLVGVPLEAAFSTAAAAAARRHLGRLGGALTPAIAADTVAAAAVAAATGSVGGGGGPGGGGGGGKGGGGGGGAEASPDAGARILDYEEMVAAAAAEFGRSAGPDLELFWDGGCPLCRREIRYYKTLDREGRVRWTDVDVSPEALAPHGISIEQAMARIHAAQSDGTLLSGVPAFLAVWDRLPYWRALPPLLRAAPGAIPAAEVAYSAFARVRLRVTGRGVGGGSACAPGDKVSSR